LTVALFEAYSFSSTLHIELGVWENRWWRPFDCIGQENGRGWVKDGVLRLAERGEVGKPSFDDWRLVPCRECKREDSGGEEGICAQRR
jgi:hypothetical protein